jgi:hypothetical protein
MKRHKKIKYTDEPIGKIKIVEDFLPNSPYAPRPTFGLSQSSGVE